MRFGVLGPLSLGVGDGHLELPGARRRALLVRLLVDAGHVVPSTRLAEDLWEGDPSPGATGTLQSHVSYLRRVVGRERLLTRANGYVLVLYDDDEFDRHTFEHDLVAGRAHLEDGRLDPAINALHRCLAAWRGPPLFDVADAAWAAPEIARLNELHCVARESLFDAELGRGRIAEVITGAEAVVAEHPLRERFWAQLITALYRSGRQADALRAYQRLRVLLADELGIDPSAELQQLEAAVLRHDPDLDAVAAASPRPAAGPVALPSGVVSFLLTDVVGSTRLWEASPGAMDRTMQVHERFVRTAVEAHGGTVLKSRGEGDSTFSVFQRATDALRAAAELGAAVRTETWPTDTPLEVRIAVHTGEASERDGDYFGRTVNRAARLRSVAGPSQVLVSQSTATLVLDALPPGRRLVEAGVVTLHDLERPEPVYVLLEPTETPSAIRLAGTPGNLPPLLSSLVGRDGEREALAGLLTSGCGIVTLVGPGGVGKTHLAVDVAGAVEGQFRGGAWIVDLSSLRDPELVADAVAAALGVAPLAARPVGEAIAERLRARPTLLVLDNCEHLLEGVADLVGHVVRARTESMVLATSRQHLGIPGERIFPLTPLPVPDDEHDPAARNCAAVQLFVERASAVRPGFVLDDANTTCIARVCRRLDGLPLAVELAAARMRAFTPAEIEARLEERFSLLRAERGLPPRHQGLVDAIDWSYDLLDEPERRLLRRLSVLPSGCDLDTVLAVLGDPSESPGATANVLDRLVDKSLVVADPRGERTRYRMLETVREYARAHLDATAEAETIRRACAEHMIGLATEAFALLPTADELTGVERLEREADNIRWAQDWAVSAGDLDLAFTGLSRNFLFSHPAGLALGAHALRLLHLPGAERQPDYPYLVVACGYLSGFFGAEAPPDADLVAALGRVPPATLQHADALGLYISRLIFTGRLAEAQRYCDEYAALAARLDDPFQLWNVCSHKSSIGFITGNDISDVVAHERALAGSLGNRSMLAITCFHEGWAEPDLDRGLERIGQGLVHARSVRNDYYRSIGLNMAAALHGRRHDYAAALAALLEGAESAWHEGELFSFGLNLNMVAGILAVNGRHAAAVLLRAGAPSLNNSPLMNDAIARAIRGLPDHVDRVTAEDLAQRAATMTGRDLLDFAASEVAALTASSAPQH